MESSEKSKTKPEIWYFALGSVVFLALYVYFGFVLKSKWVFAALCIISFAGLSYGVIVHRRKYLRSAPPGEVKQTDHYSWRKHFYLLLLLALTIGVVLFLSDLFLLFSFGLGSYMGQMFAKDDDPYKEPSGKFDWRHPGSARKVIIIYSLVTATFLLLFLSEFFMTGEINNKQIIGTIAIVLMFTFFGVYIFLHIKTKIHFAKKYGGALVMNGAMLRTQRGGPLFIYFQPDYTDPFVAVSPMGLTGYYNREINPVTFALELKPQNLYEQFQSRFNIGPPKPLSLSFLPDEKVALRALDRKEAEQIVNKPEIKPIIERLFEIGAKRIAILESTVEVGWGKVSLEESIDKSYAAIGALKQLMVIATDSATPRSALRKESLVAFAALGIIVVIIAASLVFNLPGNI